VKRQHVLHIQGDLNGLHDVPVSQTRVSNIHRSQQEAGFSDHQNSSMFEGIALKDLICYRMGLLLK
jgi:hypothetical protein